MTNKKMIRPPKKESQIKIKKRNNDVSDYIVKKYKILALEKELRDKANEEYNLKKYKELKDSCK